MWIRQCELDAGRDSPPLPTRIASNEEFIPPPQSPLQKAVEQRIADMSDCNARRLGVTRREFLRTGSGVATALLALNEIFGPCYDISAAEAADPQAFAERWPKDKFIFDVQTHHVDVGR